jgi:hypothetical protein
MPDYIDDLRSTIERDGAAFRQADPIVAARRPPEGGWSPKEVIGHLIDSASNNHQRFMRARWQDDLVFAGYAQDLWVDAQDYQAAPWEELVTLWQGYNRHIARVMATTPAAALTRQHTRHNLHEIAWRLVPATMPATLEYFMRDYVNHLRHHVRQIHERLGTSHA